MTQKISGYTFEGEYLYDGEKGRHRGEVNYYSDGKIIGISRDSDADQGNISIPKLFLGVVDGKNLAYVKLGQSKYNLWPVVGKMDSNDRDTRNGLKQNYF